MKKVISLVLAVLLLLPASVTAYAAETDTPTSGSCGDSAFWSFADGILTISGTGEVSTEYPQPWEAYRLEIEHIVIEEGITELATCCFMSHAYAKTVTLPDSLVSIGRQAFQSCDSLTEITIPKNVTDIGNWKGEQRAAPAFSGDNLENIYVDPENERFYSVDGVLFDRTTNTLLCYPMGKTATEYTVPDGILKLSYGAFWFTEATVTLPEGLTTIGRSVFFGASFSSIEIPGTVTLIDDSAFENCDQLTSITIPESVQQIGLYTFGSCEKLESITILNPDCIIPATNNVIEEDALIRGYEDSTAQQYARQFGRDFEDITTGQRYRYHLGNTGYIDLLPTETGGTAPTFISVTYSNPDTGDTSGYDGNIVLERDTTNETYREMLAFVTDLTKDCASDYEKAQIISQWVYDNMTYVFGLMGQGETAEGVYDIWAKRRGNCEGHTQLTNFLLYLVDIPNATVTSYGHTWTAALIDGEWIMVDSTNGIFDGDPEEFEDIVRICFAVDDEMTCVIDDLTGVKLVSYGLGFSDHQNVTEITIPSYVTSIYNTMFFFEDHYGKATTHLTIHGTAGSYAEAYLKENLPHYNCYTYENGMFTVKVEIVLTEDDAIYLLRHVLFPDMYLYENAPDYTGDGKVTEDDAIYLLRHVLFPELYPL